MAEGFAADLGRRVLQCRCGFARAWSGYQDAIRMGWHASYTDVGGGELVRVWVCRDCFVPAPPVLASPPVYQVPPALLDLVLRTRGSLGTPRRRNQEAERLLVGLHSCDPARFASYMREILALFDGRRDSAGKLWRAFAAAHGIPEKPRRAMGARRRGLTAC